MGLKNIPSKIVSGQHAKWTIFINDFPSDEWTLTYHVRGAAAANATATVSVDTPFAFDIDLKAVSVVSMVETPLPSGQYFWQAYATNVSTPTDKRLVDSGRLEILTDLSGTAANYDGRTDNEKIWAAIKATIAKTATKTQQSYTIGQRTLSRIPLDQLIHFEQHYAKLVTADRMKARAARGESFFETIKTKFEEPSFNINPAGDTRRDDW